MDYPDRININDTTYIRADAISDMSKPVKPKTLILKSEKRCGETELLDYYNCPYCDAGWGTTIISSKFNFCPRCGVKIDREYALSVRDALIKACEEDIPIDDGCNGEDVLERLNMEGENEMPL